MIIHIEIVSINFPTKSNSNCEEPESSEKLESFTEHNSKVKLQPDNYLLDSLINDFKIDILNNKTKQELEDLVQRAYNKRKEIRALNSDLQTKLVCSLFTTKLNPNLSPPQIDHNSETMQQYYRLLDQFSQMKKEAQMTESKFESLKTELQDEFTMLSEFTSRLKKDKDETSEKLIEYLIETTYKNSQENRKSAKYSQIVDKLSLGAEHDQLFTDLCVAKLENLELENEGASLDSKLDGSNLAMNGQHLIDFEQLVNENRLLGQKTLDRVNDIHKINSKIETQRLECVKNKQKIEKLRLSSELLEKNLQQMDEQLEEERKNLNKLRYEKDAASKNLGKEQDQCVSLVNASQTVLKDFASLGISEK